MPHIQVMKARLGSLRRFFSQAQEDTLFSSKMPVGLSTSRLFQRTPEMLVPEMPVLAAVAKAGKGLIDFKDTAFFSVQHILRTNVPLFKHLIEDFNANPRNIYLSGKGYSDSLQVESFLKKTLGIQYFKLDRTYQTTGQYQQHLRAHLRQLWHYFSYNLVQNNDIKRIIIIDEGGHSLETMPEALCFHYLMAGIEQTRGGLYSPAINSLPFPLIEVASSAIKRHLESPLIVEAIIKKLQNTLGAHTADINPMTIFGVIGNGAIGSSVTQYLISQGYTVLAYDENKDAFKGLVHKNLYRVQNVSAVIARAEYILGCTGKDTLKDTHPDSLKTILGNKKFISCTSEDKEFYSLRKVMDIQGSVELHAPGEIKCSNDVGGKVTLINGGFPMNFDQSGESVPADDIQVTRALMLGACFQAGQLASKPVGGNEMELTQRIQLDTILQHFVAQEFRKYQPEGRYSEEQWKLTEDLNWIKNNSGGIEREDSGFANNFQSSSAAENLRKHHFS